MPSYDDGSAYFAEMDSSATPEEIAEVQRLFDEIALDLHVTATYTVRSAGAVVHAVLYLVGAGVATAFLAAARSFGRSFGQGAGNELGPYAGKRIKDWLEQLGHARGREVPMLIQDSSVRAEILLTGDEPSEALERLKELLDNNEIAAIPGKAAQVQYREGDGWVRPF